MNKNNINIEKSKIRRKSKTTQKNNDRKHKKKIMRVVIYITLVLFVLSLLFLIGFGIYKFSTSSKYVVKNITFEGNVKYSAETLGAMLGETQGANIFKVSKREIRDTLEALPYIKTVKVNKNLPDTLKINVVEHTSYFFAYNKETNKYVKLTIDGVILEESELEAKEADELMVFGINFDYELKEAIAEIENAKLLNYMEIKSIYEQEKIDREITSVEFKEGNIILTLNYDINVILNSNDISYTLNLLKKILEEIPGKAGTIDMTAANPIFRENIK